MKKLKSKYFKIEEFTASETAEKEDIDNSPTSSIVTNLNWLCLKILDPLRAKLDKPIIVTSGYRSKNLNRKIGGSKTSQHCKGKAVDIVISDMNTNELFDYIIENTKLPFDQVINEYEKWIHISYDRDKSAQRGNKMIATKEDGKTVYKEI